MKESFSNLIFVYKTCSNTTISIPADPAASYRVMAFGRKKLNEGCDEMINYSCDGERTMKLSVSALVIQSNLEKRIDAHSTFIIFYNDAYFCEVLYNIVAVIRSAFVN